MEVYTPTQCHGKIQRYTVLLILLVLYMNTVCILHWKGVMHTYGEHSSCMMLRYHNIHVLRGWGVYYQFRDKYQQPSVGGT